MSGHSKLNDVNQAFSSKCSESIDEAPSALYEAVTKNLHNQRCTEHQKPYEYFYSQSLLCESCLKNVLMTEGRSLSSDQFHKIQHLYHLKNIVNHPVILLAGQQSLLQYPIQIIDLITKSYQPLFSKKNDFSAQKKLLHAFIDRIKAKINSLCESLLSSFERAEEHLISINQYREEMKHIGKMYEQQFLELVSQKYSKGNKSQIQQIFNDYRINNQNPFDKIFNNLDSVMSHLSQSPIINTSHLVNLYTSITDERLWKSNSIVSTRTENSQLENTEMILNAQEVVLQDEYVLQMNQKCVLLKKGDLELGRLNTTYDSLYHLSKYRLIGVNYESIQIISYFDRLKVQQIFEIEGCTDVLPFQNEIVVISNQNLIKIDLNTKECCIFGSNFKDLRYDNKKSLTFTCQNAEGRRARWSLKSTEPYQVSF